VDEDIVFDFVSLKDMDEEQKSKIRKESADAGVQLVDRGIVSSAEERQRLAEDPNSGYDNLQTSAESDITGEEDSPLGAGEMDLPEGQEAEAAGKTSSVQASAMNGAQVTSLLEIINKVVTGEMPKETAFYVMAAAFPAVASEAIKGMLGPIKEATMVAPQVSPGLPNASVAANQPTEPSKAS
jgi:hypothetical protein